MAPLEVEDPADFPALLADLQTKAADAVSQAVLAQDDAASAIKSSSFALLTCNFHDTTFFFNRACGYGLPGSGNCL